MFLAWEDNLFNHNFIITLLSHPIIISNLSTKGLKCCDGKIEMEKKSETEFQIDKILIQIIPVINH